MIRFVHTSPSVGNIDVMVGDTLTFTNTTYKSISEFFPTGAGQRRIRIYKAGVAHSTATLLVDETRLLTASRAYTLYTKSGLTANGPTTTTGTGIVVNR
ncbi:MAG: DUF4397 domain-containing protein [Mucilaginibacter sp.]|nr:DUF4397 domain-containing protein [Mucilaginibacter sp.]